MSDTTFIYALTDPRPGDVHVYIGKSNSPFSRFKAHISESKRIRNRRTNWLQSLCSLGTAPGFEILKEVSKTEWQFWEMSFIHWYRVLGWKVVNDTDGGEGSENPSVETRAKLSASKKGKKKPQRSVEHCANISAAHSGKKLSLEHRAAIGLALTGLKRSAPHSVEHRAKISATLTGKKQSPETIAKRVSKTTGKKRTPEARARMSVAAYKRYSHVL